MAKNIGLGTLDDQLVTLDRLHKDGLESIRYLKQEANKPSYDKMPKTYSISEVERIIDIPRSTIRDNEHKNKINYPTIKYGQRKSEYTLEDIKLLRDFFDKGFFNGKVKRPKHLSPLIFSLAMFKGGVGKTTQSTHLATHCALEGLNTLLIDLDAQASATLTLGYVPSIDLDNGNTIYDTLVNDFDDITNVIKPTHYYGLDIVTAGLELQGADLILPNYRGNNADKLGSPLLRLKKALSIKAIQNKYDVIILDCAPNHAATTMNALTASDGIILPITPSMLSYGSSIQFIETLKELTESLINYRDSLNPETETEAKELKILNNMSNKLFGVLITNDEGNKENIDTSDAIKGLYTTHVIQQHMIHTIALPRTSNDLALLYDIKRSEVRGSKESFDRGLFCMKEVNQNIVSLIKGIWGVENNA